MKCILFCLATLIFPAGIDARAADSFARRYSAPPEYAAWQGQVDAIPNTTNYLLTAYSVVTNNVAEESVLSLAELQSDGTVDWALSSTQGLRGELAIRAVPNLPLVYAKLEGLPDEDFWTVFGLFNARDGSRVFERGIPVVVDESQPGFYSPETSPRVDTLTDGRSTVVLGGSGRTLHLAVLDRTGAPQWERSFSASAFEDGAPLLLEYPGKGFWLVVQGRRAISTDPNPPAVNTAQTLSIVRLSDKGEVLWTTKLAGLLTSAPVLSVRPVAIGSDGTLILPLTDTIINTWGTPALLDVVTYLFAVAPDGSLRWGRRIPGVTLATPLVSPVASANNLILFGQKLVSPTAITGDNVMLRLNLSTGALVTQTSVSHSVAEYVSPVGITASQVFFQGTTPASAEGTRTLIGSMNLNLSGAVWKQFDRLSATSAVLSFNSTSGTLVFSDTSAPKIEALTLDLNLTPLISTPGTISACASFSDVAVPLVNPDVRVETVILTPSFLAMSVVDTEIPLLPSTRIELRPIRLQVEDLWPEEAGSGLSGLALRGDGTGILTLSFPSQKGKNYELLFTPSLIRPFLSIESIAGDGTPISRIIGAPKDDNGFFFVRMAVP